MVDNQIKNNMRDTYFPVSLAVNRSCSFYKYQFKSLVCYRRLLTPYDRYLKNILF